MSTRRSLLKKQNPLVDVSLGMLLSVSIGLGTAANAAAAAADAIANANEKYTIAVIGTGDMGDSLGPRFASLGHKVIYGSREPGNDRVRQLVERTGSGASAASPVEAVRVADIVVLAVPWPGMEKVARNLGPIEGKIVVDISMPSKQGSDGYEEPLLATSSAEMIQGWNPGARVVKAFATQGSFVVDDPETLDGPATVPIASNDRQAKEVVARLAANLGLDPVDAGPLRMSREIEALQRLYMVPLLQRRSSGWEPYFRRSSYWECIWQDDWSEPVADAKNLATIPETQGPARPCPGR